MKTIPGTPLSTATFREHRHVRDLDWFEGPLLCHFKDGAESDYLYSWVDCDESAHRWLVMQVSEALIRDLAADRVTLTEVVSSLATTERVCFIDFDGSGTALRASSCVVSAIPADYLPKADVADDRTPTEPFEPHISQSLVVAR